MILINTLMGVWKAEKDSVPEQVVATTGDLPPQSMHDANHQDIVLVPQGPGRAEIAAGDYAYDTEAVALSPDALQHLPPATERRLRLTGHEVNVGKATTWTVAGVQAQPMRLLGAPFPIEGEFRCLGIGIRVNPEHWTGPLQRQ